MRTTQTVALLSAIALFGAAAPAVADDAKAQDLYDRAHALYDQRSANRSITTNAASLAEQAANVASDSELKYRALVLASRSHYWNGMKLPENDKNGRMTAFQKSMDVALKAKKLMPAVADAYYYYAISLGRWGLAKGVTESLGRREELRNWAEEAKKRETLDFEPGAEIDGHGPNRTLGRLEFSLPWPLGDNDKALDFLREAVTRAPKHSLNIVYYAEVLAKKSQEAEACRLLNDLLSKNPAEFGKHLNRVPETVDEFELAKALRTRICGR